MTQNRVLIADLNPAVHEILCADLTAHGYAVLTASTPLEALAQTDLYQPQVILLDEDLIFSDGDFQQHLYSVCPTFHIFFFISARLIKILGYYPDNYVTKPFDPEEIRLRLKYLLG